MTELIKCECGRKPRLKYRLPWSWVECKKCKIQTDIYGDTYEEGDGKAEAIEAWNCREGEKQDGTIL